MLTIGNLIKKQTDLEQEISKLEAYVEGNSSKGSLISRDNGKGGYEYSKRIIDSSGQKKEIYLPRSAINETKALAYNGYAKRRLMDARKEKRLVDEEIEMMQSESHVSRYMRMHPGVASLLEGYRDSNFSEMLSASEEEVRARAKAWNKEKYNRSNEHPEDLTVPTGVPGLFTRSKSEALIIGRFEYWGVAYHYEELFVPDKEIWLPAGIVFHPDFKCINFRTGKIFWWEHQGQWDLASYTRNLARREEYLFNMGLVPWKNLLITTETEAELVDLEWVDYIIKHFLL